MGRWQRQPWFRWVAGAAAFFALALATTLVIAGGGGPEPVAEAPVEAEPPEPPEPPGEADRDEGDDHEHEGEADDEDPHGRSPETIDEAELGSEERRAARTVRAYIEGLDERDGRAVCRLLAPGAIDAVDLPRERGGCARSLRASIGYRDPRGLPVWESTEVQGLLRVELDGDRASVTATTVTRFADRAEPSIEDDVVHLRRDGDRWLIAKASSTLYRAVGIDQVPLHVLVAPE